MGTSCTSTRTGPSPVAGPARRHAGNLHAVRIRPARRAGLGRDPAGAAATIAFTFFGLGDILSDAFRMNTSAWPPAARAATNAGYLAGCVRAMLLILRKTGAWR